MRTLSSPVRVFIGLNFWSWCQFSGMVLLSARCWSSTTILFYYLYLIIFESNVNNFRVLNLNFQIHFECWHRYVIGSRKVRISIWYLVMYAIPDFFQITAMPSRNYFTASRSVAKISHIGNPFLPICSPNAHVRCQEASWFMNGGRRELWGDF